MVGKGVDGGDGGCFFSSGADVRRADNGKSRIDLKRSEEDATVSGRFGSCCDPAFSVFVGSGTSCRFNCEIGCETGSGSIIELVVISCFGIFATPGSGSDVLEFFITIDDMGGLGNVVMVEICK